VATYYIDPANGNDANNGSTWALAWKTITFGATAARTAAGDTIRIAKSPVPTSLGQAQWKGYTSASVPSTTAVTATANNGSGLIRITSASHGLVTGDVAQIVSVTGTVEANGMWLVTYVSATQFDLQNSAYVNAWVSGGTVRRSTHRAVILSTACTKTIDNCDVSWTPGAQTTSSLTQGTAKEGSGSIAIITAATCNANQILAYHGLPASIDLSGYQQISFWLRGETAVVATGELQIRLYSDAACTTLVETLSINTTLTIGDWIPIVVNKGSALSATVQGIAVYTTVAKNANTFYVDNFIACKAASSADSLTLLSLISKNSTAKGTTSSVGYGNEAWVAPQSIKDTIIILDGQTQYDEITFPTGRGYYGTTETVTTYKRETFTKTDGAGGRIYTTYCCDLQEGGADGNPITYTGGWNTATTVQDGETFFDGGSIATVVMWNRANLTFDNISTTRGAYGWFITNGTCYGITVSGTNCNNHNNGWFPDMGYMMSGTFHNTSYCWYGSNLGYSGGNSYMRQRLTVYKANSNIVSPCYSNMYIPNSELTIYEACNNDMGVSISGDNQRVHIGYVNYIANYGLILSGCQNCVFTGVIGSSCSYGAINMQYAGPGNNYFNNMTLGTTTLYQSYIQDNCKNYFTRYNNTANDHRIFNGGYATIQTDTIYRHSATGPCWKLAFSDSSRNAFYPVNLVIARIACVANKLVTVRAWFMKTGATQIGGKMLIRGKQIAGLESDIEVTKANDTVWQLLSLSFTPTASGVVEVEALAWYISSTSYGIYVDDISVYQE
jgi:hypothetical protein